MNLISFPKYLPQKRKPLFRKPAGSFRLSVLLSLLVGAHAVFAAPATGANTARKQIHASVIASAASSIKQEAKRRSWPEYQAKMNVFIPAEVSQYPACNSPLTASLPGGDRLDLNRIRYDVRCGDSGGWDVAVTVKPDIYLPVLVAKETLERGQVLSASDMQFRKYNISSTRGGYITNPDDIVGLTVKRRLRELQPISLSQLEAPVMVERGQQVVMIARQDGIEARTMGEALKKGRKGEMIKVKNSSSERVVTAIVDGMGVVKMVYASGN
ncbi:flagellar basal body P-ring formation chaperone FlgA [Dryocola boscaweniae]